jgi:carbon storage regulator CsrA
MLVISRKEGERVFIDGGIVVTVARIQNKQVRIAIKAPPDVGIFREEILPLGGAAATEEPKSSPG